jgi:hypothetical protein
MSIQEKIDNSMEKLQQVVDQYNQANQVVQTSREQILSLQGAISALKELQNETPLVNKRNCRRLGAGCHGRRTGCWYRHSISCSD